jgi:hypothetical protein
MVGCQVLRATAHGGLGNQLLYLLSVAVLVNFLNIPTCHLKLASFRYGSKIYDDFKHVLPGFAQAVEPCVILAPDSPWTHQNVSTAEVIYRYKRSAKKLSLASSNASKLESRIIQAACARVAEADKSRGSTQSTLRLDHYYNFCGAAGLVRALDMPPLTYWSNMAARAYSLFHPISASGSEPSLKVNESTLCVHIRARTLEPITSNTASEIGGEAEQKARETRCTHAFPGRWKKSKILDGLHQRKLKAQGRRRGVCKGIQSPLEPVERTLNRAAQALRAQQNSGSTLSPFQSLFVASPIPVDIPRSLTSLGVVQPHAFAERAQDMGGWTSTKAAISDLETLSLCSTVRYLMIVSVLCGHLCLFVEMYASLIVGNYACCLWKRLYLKMVLWFQRLLWWQC